MAAVDYLLRCDVDDPERARNGRTLAGLLFTLVVMCLLAFVVFVLLNPDLRQNAPTLVAAGVLFLVYVYNRRGHVERTGKITIATILVLLNVLGLWSVGASYPVAFIPYMWAVPIALAGAFLTWRAVLVTWVGSVANVAVLYVAVLARASGFDHAGNTSWILSAQSILTDLALITAFVRYQSERHLRAVAERNVELREKQRELSEKQEELARLNDSLESQVRARTAELAAARDEAVRASRVKSDFMANMSHEMRTPMNAVLGMTGMLLDMGLTAEQRALAEDVRTAGGHLLGVIDDVLDLSRIEAGEMMFRDAAFEVRGCVRDAVTIVALAAREKGLTLRTEIAPQVPVSAISDATRLRQVLVHLLVNAVKFTHQGSVSVRVDVAEEGGDRPILRFAVEDTGIGIPPGRRSTLFVPFAQIDSSMTRKYGGTGVGLVLCKHIVERMGGVLGFESELGKGSKFTFTLPMTVAAGASASRPSASKDEPAKPPLGETANKHPLRILSVEDNPLNQKVILSLLRKLGYTADTASNGVEAVGAVEKKSYDVVLMDIQMPEMDGMEAARTIGARVPPEHRPWIIALTAHAMNEYRDQCLAAGMNDYLAKPMTSDMLQSVLLRARERADLHG